MAASSAFAFFRRLCMSGLLSAADTESYVLRSRLTSRLSGTRYSTRPMSPTPGVMSRERFTARARSFTMSVSSFLESCRPGSPLNVAVRPDPAIGLRPFAICSLFGLVRMLYANELSIASLHAPLPPGPVHDRPDDNCAFWVDRATSSGSYTFKRFGIDDPSPPAIPGRSK